MGLPDRRDRIIEEQQKRIHELESENTRLNSMIKLSPGEMMKLVHWLEDYYFYTSKATQPEVSRFITSLVRQFQSGRWRR